MTNALLMSLNIAGNNAHLLTRWLLADARAQRHYVREGRGLLASSERTPRYHLRHIQQDLFALRQLRKAA